MHNFLSQDPRLNRFAGISLFLMLSVSTGLAYLRHSWVNGILYAIVILAIFNTARQAVRAKEERQMPKRTRDVGGA